MAADDRLPRPSRSRRQRPRPPLAASTSSFALLAALLILLLLSALAAVARASLMAPTAPPTAAPSVFYDAFSTRIFDPTGRVLQLEYALEATRKGGAAVGAVEGGLACLASWTPRFSRRMAPAARQPALGIWEGDAHVALAGSGMATDALALVETARRECRAHRYIYDSPANVGRLVMILAQEAHETERARIVPYAVDLLVAGCDDAGGTGPCLYNIGPGGVYGSYRACAVGREAGKARLLLEARVGKGGGGGNAAVPSMAGLQRLAGTVLKALMLTVPEGTTTGAGAVATDDADADSSAGPTATEDISLVVVGKGLPVTRLAVAWEPRRRRLEVRVPAALAAALRRDREGEGEG